MRINKFPLFSSMLMLVVGAFLEAPYYFSGYYQILRIVVCLTGAYFAYLSYINKHTSWSWLLIIVAILFNPIVPIHLDKIVWGMIDLIVTVIFGVFLFKFRRK